DEVDRGFVATFWVDQIRRGVLADDRVQPGHESADTPAGFVGHKIGRGLELLDNRITGRLDTLGHAEHGLTNPRTGDGNLEESAHQRSRLAVRKAHLLVEHDGQRLGVWPKLAGAAAQRVGRLQRVPALNTFAAAAALTDRDVEPAMDRLAGKLDLILILTEVCSTAPPQRGH